MVKATKGGIFPKVARKKSVSFPAREDPSGIRKDEGARGYTGSRDKKEVLGSWSDQASANSLCSLFL